MEKFQQVWLLLKNFEQTILVFFESILKFIANFSLNIIDYILNFFNLFFQFVANFWEKLDPSLFQNVILGSLVIFVFVAEYIAIELKNQKEVSILYEMITTDKIINSPRILLAVFALIFFSSRFDNTFEKIVSIIILVIFLFFWSNPIIRFNKIFLEREELDRKFLENLKFPKIFRFANKTTVLQMEKAWTLVWNSNTEYKEEFTKIFIDHIDSAIKFKKMQSVIKLFGIYLNSFDKQTDLLKIAFSILPKIFEWDEKFWNLKRQKIKNRDGWWQDGYFRNNCLPVIIKKLIENESYPFVSSFKEHAQKMEEKMNKIINTTDRKKYNNYINQVFSCFFVIFFNHTKLNQESSFSRSAGYNFPNECQITMSNIDKKNKNNKTILIRITYTFIKWARSIAFFTKDENQNLTAAVNLLFPKVHSSLFTVFLALLFNFQREIKYAIEKKPNFRILPIFYEFFVSSGDDDKDREEELLELDKRKKEEKEETIQVILNFFTPWWEPLIHYKNDFTEDECKNWKNMEENDREKIFTKIKIKKLKEVKIELENLEIKEIPNEEYRQENKKNCLELIELLIENLENKKTV